MCEFCKEYEKVKRKYEPSISLNIRIARPPSDLGVDFSQYTIGDDKIRYCPKCGKRLNKGKGD